MEPREIKTWEEDNYFGGGLPDRWLDNEDDFTHGLEPPCDEDDE
jgi:hypothetical protein